MDLVPDPGAGLKDPDPAGRRRIHVAGSLQPSDLENISCPKSLIRFCIATHYLKWKRLFGHTVICIFDLFI